MAPWDSDMGFQTHPCHEFHCLPGCLTFTELLRKCLCSLFSPSTVDVGQCQLGQISCASEAVLGSGRSSRLEFLRRKTPHARALAWSEATHASYHCMGVVATAGLQEPCASGTESEKPKAGCPVSNCARSGLPRFLKEVEDAHGCRVWSSSICLS